MNTGKLLGKMPHKGRCTNDRCCVPYGHGPKGKHLENRIAKRQEAVALRKLLKEEGQ